MEKIKQNTRIYARKQMTWFKRDKEIVWVHPEEMEKPNNKIQNFIRENILINKE